MRTKRGTKSRLINVRLDKNAEDNIAFITESADALLGAKLTPSIIIRRALALLGDAWMDQTLNAINQRGTAEEKLRNLAAFQKSEREALIEAAGRWGEKVTQARQLEGR